MNYGTNRHCDCRNYAAVDVLKGICRRTKELVLGDEPHCAHFASLAKCANCSHFALSDEEYMGICGAETEKPWTYPDLVAITCKMYVAAPQ